MTVTRCEYDANGDLCDASYARMTRAELEAQVQFERGRQIAPDIYEVPAPPGGTIKYYIA